MTTKTLRDYAVNGADRYWSVSVVEGRHGRADLRRNIKFWTLTIHEKTCRHVPLDPHHIRAYGREDLAVLADKGFDPPTLFSRYVWKGCKTCGTVGLDARALGRDEVRALAQEIAASRAAYLKRDAVRSAVREAAAHRVSAIRSAHDAWLEQHTDEIEAVQARAIAIWEAANPEEALLLADGAKGGEQ